MKNSKNLIQKIKSHKKYRYLSDDIIKKEIRDYIKKNQISEKEITKQDIKEIRARLHRIYSSYQTKGKKKIDDLLNELNNILNKRESKSEIFDITNKLLSTMLSTKERLNDYQLIYSKIFKITGRPNSIVDLGSGFNVFSFPLMGLDKLTYYAYDINEKDVWLINKYIKITPSLRGKAEILDVRDVEKMPEIPKSDVVFMFKLVDLLDTKTAEEIIRLLIKKTRYVVVSFAIKTLTCQQMNKPVRKWFELMLKRNVLRFEIIKIENEIFYVVWKDG